MPGQSTLAIGGSRTSGQEVRSQNGTLHIYHYMLIIHFILSRSTRIVILFLTQLTSTIIL